MAQRPLILQQSRASLISGSELPKASGAGVGPVDIESPFRQLASDIQRKNEENSMLTSKIEGQRYAEQEFAADTSAGLDINGRYSQLKPIPAGDRFFQASYFDSRAQNAASLIRQDLSSHFNSIQSNFDEPFEVRIQKMQQYADGMVTTLDPLLREQARAESQREIESRSATLSNQDRELRWTSTVNGIKTDIDNETELAISAAASGADTKPHTDRILKRYDEAVRLKTMSEQSAQTAKEQTLRFVQATGQQQHLADQTFKGNVDPFAVEEFATALQSGGSAQLRIDEQFLPSNFNDEKERTGNIQLRTIADTDVMRQAFGDPQTTEAVATELRRMAQLMQQKLKANEGRRDLFEEIRILSSDDTTPLSPTQHTEYNKVVEEWVLAKHHKTPEGRDALMRFTRATKYMSPVLSKALVNSVMGNSIDEARGALELYNSIIRGENGAAQTGGMILKTISGEDQAVLESAADEMNDIANAGLDPKGSADRWQRFQKMAQDPKNTLKFWTDDFYAKTDKNFTTAVAERFREHYDMNTMPPDISAEVERAYRVSMSMTTNPDAATVFDKTIERVFGRYTASPIYEGGIERAGPLDDPISYRNPNMWASNKDQWINDYVKDQVLKMRDKGLLVLDAQTSAFLDQTFTAGRPRYLGEFITLEGTGANRDSPQFNVILKTEDGPVRLLVRDGARQVPLLLDPGIVRAHLNAKAQLERELSDLEKTGDTQRQNMIRTQYNKRWGDSSQTERSMLPKFTNNPMSEEDFQKFFMEQPEEWQKAYTKTLADQADALEKGAKRLLNVEPSLPAGTDIGPTTLMQSRATGQDVTVAAVQRINSVLPMSDNGNYLLNIASAESDYGTHPNTFRPAGDRGIFQVNDSSKGAFVEVKRRANIPGSNIAIAAEKLKVLGIDVANLQKSDLDKPLVSAAVARLYLLTDPAPLPTTVEEQAERWKEDYNTVEGDGTVEGFLAKANRLVLPTAAQAGEMPASMQPRDGPATVTDMQGRPSPANFTAMQPMAQESAKRLASAFGAPLRITPHGGRQPDKRSATSQHKTGLAIDVYVEDYSDADKRRLIATAIAMGYRGIGGYAAGDGKGTLHFDLRGGGRHNGLGLWWRKVPGVDGPWKEGPDWFTGGVNDGLAMRGNSA